MRKSQFAWLLTVAVVSASLTLQLSFGFSDDSPSAGEKSSDSAAAAKKPSADGEKPKTKPADPGTPKPSDPKPAAKDPLDQWKALAQRKIEIARKLRDLRKEFYKPLIKDERKKEIRDEFTQLVSEYRIKIETQLNELAAAVYEKDPHNVEAAEMVMENTFNRNQYQQALDVAKNVLEGAKKSKYDTNLAINIAGAASFALNQFEQAQDYLKQAEKDGKLDERYGRRFLTHTADYIKFWEKEQEIRDREAKAKGDEQLPRAELTINSGKQEVGKIVIELFENEAPNAVANFISIIQNEKNNYDGVKFHRVIQNFMAQTGDLKASGKKAVGYTIECECYADNARKHFRGSVSMALQGRDTGSSELFFTHLPTYWLNEEVDPNSVHTVFGRVVEGMDVVDKIKQGDVIATAKVIRKRKHEYKPKTTPNKKDS